MQRNKFDTETMGSLSILPTEIIDYLFSFLSLEDMAKLRSLSKSAYVATLNRLLLAFNHQQPHHANEFMRHLLDDNRFKINLGLHTTPLGILLAALSTDDIFSIDEEKLEQALMSEEVMSFKVCCESAKLILAARREPFMLRQMLSNLGPLIINLPKADLRGIDLSYAVLRGANLKGAKLRLATLIHADLRNADLSEADLSDATMKYAKLNHANLYATNLERADLQEAELKKTHLHEANLANAYLLNVDLYEADLSRADLSGANLSGTNLTSATLHQTNLTRANLCSTSLWRVDMSEAHLEQASLNYAYLEEANMSSVYLQGAALFCTKLVNVNLAKVFLYDLDLSEADLHKANLNEAIIESKGKEGKHLYPKLISDADCAEPEYLQSRLDDLLSVSVAHLGQARKWQHAIAQNILKSLQKRYEEKGSQLIDIISNLDIAIAHALFKRFGSTNTLFTAGDAALDNLIAARQAYMEQKSRITLNPDRVKMY
jgi:uncharacterized protein YjbI with pentapeptide repeats